MPTKTKPRVKFLAEITVKQVGVGSITYKRADAEGQLTIEEKEALVDARRALTRMVRCRRLGSGEPVPQPPEKT